MKEFLISEAEVVESFLFTTGSDETVFGSFAVTGEEHTELPAIFFQCCLFGLSERLLPLRQSVSFILKSLIGYCTMGGIGDMGGIFGQYTTTVAGGGLFPSLAALGHFQIADDEVERAFLGVNDDRISALDESDGPADMRFWCDVPDDKAMGAT